MNLKLWLLFGCVAVAVGCADSCVGVSSLADGGDDGGDAGEVDAGPADAGEVDAGPYGLLARPPNPTCVAPARPLQQSGVAVQRAFPALTFSQPLGLMQAPGEPGRAFVMERLGTVRAFPFDAGATSADVQLVLDLRPRVNAAGEGGLLGMAFHPQWAARKELFVSYTTTGSGGAPLRSVVSRVLSRDNGATFDAASEQILLQLDQPFTNHDGGGIAFGPDGFLYIGFGDGGSGGDPLNSGQRLNTLLGKFLRLDVDVPAAQKYAIPPTNPFAASGAPCNLTSSASTGTAARCAEIYAWGLRNPWRFSFDQATFELWAGDVGQDTWEEVDRIALGGNYGWNVREGTHCYGAASCATAGLIEPVLDYGRSDGYSVTGGFVYRGSAIPSLVGEFIFGDYGSGRVWALEFDALTGAAQKRLLQDTSFSLASFAQTQDGEVYLLDAATGQVHQLVPQGAVPADPLAPRLSLTGCFSPADPRQPLPALIPYDLNAPLWSDGAEKLRAFAIPDGTTIAVGPDGDWDFPNGSVLVKTFLLGGRRVETRLLMRHPDGVWQGYSYEWADDESDAVLLPAGKAKAVGAQTWSYPSRPQCLQCHTAAAGRSLGLETAQLNRELSYPRGVTRHQLLTLDGLGFFTEPLGPLAALPRLESPSGAGPLDARARAYLHANCSICHRAGGAGQGPQDFRASLTLPQVGVCGVAPQHGTVGLDGGALLLAPGDPGHSVLSVRMHATDARRMPPLGSAVVDAAGAALVDQWIESVTACP